jgi:TPR repeat protein
VAGLLPRNSLDLDAIVTPQFNDTNILEEDMLNFEIDTMITFEEGMEAHRNLEHEKAWECFKYHAKNGNAYAKYWMGYYLWKGIHIQKNQDEAVKLIKEAADKGVPDAQLRYAITLQKDLVKKEKRDEFMKYLTLSADGGNSNAQFNLGNLYINGKLNVPKVEKKGIHYLKLSALQDHQNAVKLLETMKIDFTEEPDY